MGRQERRRRERGGPLQRCRVHRAVSASAVAVEGCQCQGSRQRGACFVQHHAYADPDSRGAQASIVGGSRMLAAPMRRGSPHLACCLAPRPQLLQARRALLATDQGGMDRAHPDALRKFGRPAEQKPQQAPMHAMCSYFGAPDAHCRDRALRSDRQQPLWACKGHSPHSLALPARQQRAASPQGTMNVDLGLISELQRRTVSPAAHRRPPPPPAGAKTSLCRLLAFRLQRQPLFTCSPVGHKLQTSIQT